jgi:hypothetical protein
MVWSRKTCSECGIIIIINNINRTLAFCEWTCERLAQALPARSKRRPEFEAFGP